ncbi:UV-damage endonuclease [Thelotrema lepadinum]|nr:UV-damage endonuclease [Thelotrema lepadinum]
MARPKRKSSTIAQDVNSQSMPPPPPAKRRAREKAVAASTNPAVNSEILDGVKALRASPDAEEESERFDVNKVGLTKGQVKEEAEDVPSLVEDAGSASPLSDLSDAEPPPPKLAKKTGKAAKGGKAATSEKAAEPEKPAKNEKAAKSGKAVKSTKDVSKPAPKKESKPEMEDPEAEGEEEADEVEIKEALSRPPPVHSDYLPLPWKGRIGYACLNTYLRFSNPPVFSSRTCRIASILENRHPLQNPDEPPHPTKNRPDKGKPADVARGQLYVENICLANVKDIIKMVRWNDKYGIKFMRLSSEMFPFASHEEYGYKLAPFASEALADAGKVIAKLGHRVTTHPGQFTQLGSPRKQVISNAIRDLEYHAEMLSLLKLLPQQDRDAVMILHLGGVFGDKGETLDRFRENYSKLSPGIKKRLVLENDDVSWSVHDLLPVCEELNIPFVLDFHHHNIIFDPEQIREGTKDIMGLFPRILQTWRRKDITPKMHYSEPTPAAITGRQRRKHSPRVATLPPCPPDMDLMIEAKDKEQAVFELMRTFKLPGYHLFNDIIPHIRKDDNKVVRTPKKKKGAEEAEDPVVVVVPDDEVGMGGAEGRVYWPPGMEEWLRPVKRVVKKKGPEDSKAQAKKPSPKVKEEEENVEDEVTVADEEAAAPVIKTKGGKAPAKKTTENKETTTSKKPARASRGKKVNYAENDD